MNRIIQHTHNRLASPWRQVARLSLLVLGAGLLQYCATPVPPATSSAVGSPDVERMDLIHERIRAESEQLLERQQLLQETLERAAPRPRPEPEAPVEPDPLDDIPVIIDVHNEDVQNVLRALAEQAGMSLLLDPELSNLDRRISMTLRDVPASLVFERILQLLDLHGEVQENVLIVRPFREVIYSLDFLADVTSMNFTLGGDVFGANNSLGGGGAGGSAGGGASGGQGGQSGMTGNLSLTGGNNGNAADPFEQLESMLEDLIGAQREAEVVLPGIALPRDAAQAAQLSMASNPVYSLNRMTGTLYLRARPSQVENVDRLVNLYRSVLERQVLIEAQILDVSLNEQFHFGIDWGLLRSGIAAGYGGSGLTMDGLQSDLPIPNDDGPGRSVTLPGLSTGDERSLGALYSTATFSAALDMLDHFGSVRVLSNPTIRARNSRPAFISVGRNSRYISESSAVTNSVGGGDTVTSTSVTTGSVFNGIMLGVQPFIGEDGTINLSVHPMQSEVQQESLALVDVGGDNRVSLPVIDFKGLTTSLSMHSGDTIILGGLIDQTGNSGGDGVPGLRDLPGLGAVFGRSAQRSSVRELVIVLRVSVIE